MHMQAGTKPHDMRPHSKRYVEVNILAQIRTCKQDEMRYYLKTQILQPWMYAEPYRMKRLTLVLL